MESILLEDDVLIIYGVAFLPDHKLNVALLASMKDHSQEINEASPSSKMYSAIYKVWKFIVRG